MMNRTRKRDVINRKQLDLDCPVDNEVIKILHQYGVSKQGDKEAAAAQTNIKTIKLIRKDVFKSMPGILDNEIIVDAEIIN